ncbi:MAG: hypothetical protein EZS28_046875, partial [Streblomastix strix]
LKPYTSVWEMWCDMKKKVIGEQELSQLEQQRYKRLCGIAEWEGTGGGPGSGGAMLQTSIHMSVAHAGE